MGKKAKPAAEEQWSDSEGSDAEDERRREEAALAAIRSERSGAAPAPEIEKESSAEQKRRGVMDREALKERTEDIRLDPVDFGFEETFMVASSLLPEDVIADPDNDLIREVGFYNQALLSVKAARAQFDVLGLAHQRPDDYLAEMIKSDAHMARVKQRLVFEQQKMDAFEQRKQQQEYKKVSKKLQAEKLKEKAARKKSNMKNTDQYRGFTSGGRSDDAGPSRKRGKFYDDAGPSKKRMAKDRKFGYGTRKNKKNNAESFRSFDKTDRQQFHNSSKRDGGGNKKGKSKPRRPGKNRRNRQRNK